MKSHRIFALIIGAAFFAGIITTGHHASHASSEAARMDATVQAAGRGAPLINLRDGFDLSTSHAGTQELVRNAQPSDWRPVALASADFDGDGVADIVSGYASTEGGILALRRGNIDSIYPNHRKAAASGNSPAPFEPEAKVFELAVAPEFLGAGDFNNDGHQDLLATAQGSNALYLIPGDGGGSLSRAERFELPGSVTFMVTGQINRPDGLTDAVVAVAGSDGPRLLLFKSVASEPEVITLPAEANALALGQFDNGYETDLAVAAGRRLLIVRGRDESEPARVETRELEFAILSMAAGDFSGDNREELALMAEDGAVRLLERTDPELFQASGETPESEAAAAAQPADQPGSQSKAEKRSTRAAGKTAGENPEGENEAAWQMSDAINLPAFVRSSVDRRPHELVAAKVSAGPKKDLIFLDLSNHQLQILSQETESENRGLTTSALPRLAASLDVEGGAIAALPMRLNSDALNDLIILRSGSTAPTAIVSAPAVTFTVNSTADPGAGGCDAAECTLREAITAANGAAGADEIRFNIPGAGPHTINLTSTLPAITQQLTINGTTEPDFTAGNPVVELNGTGAGGAVVGLTIAAATNNCTIRGLVINRFSLHGVQVQGTGSNIIEGNFIGTDPGGTIDRGNTQLGVGIFDSSNNTVGGTTGAALNLVSGNNIHGVQVSDTATAGAATNNQIRGNFIGTSKNGAADLGNTQLGVGIFDAPNNQIGGAVAGAPNVISGNNSRGIQITGEASDGNQMQGNLIGTNSAGTADLGNTTDGILVTTGADNNTIGGTTAAARNVISGNDDEGIEINGNGTTGHLVQGNFIGTNVNGTGDLGNTQMGVLIITSASANTVGGTVAGARNVISGNDLSGIDLEAGATQNIVQGNFIGTDVTGTLDLGNTQVGVVFFNNTTANNTIGGTTAEARNIISGNNLNGVSFNSGANQNIVQGNFIGTDVTGTLDLGNTGDGVRISASPANTIGGASAEARNIISGNSSDGVDINGAASTGNTVQGNFIGTDVTGSQFLGNTSDGVEIVDAPNNTIGGTATDAGNLISSNINNGVIIDGDGATGNIVQGNGILANISDGVEINGGAANNQIGGAAAGAGNIIAFNLNNGVDVSEPTSTGNRISSNSIFDNTDLGIDLEDDGVTANDTGDGDTGGNNLQNFPVLLSACNAGGNTTLLGTLNSTANTQFTLEFFSNASCDDSGFGEGEILIHTMMVTTDAGGNVTFTANITPAVSVGQTVTATATNPSGNTSEFSECAQVTAGAGAVARLSPATAVNPVGTSHTVTATVLLNCSPAAGTTVNFNITAGPNAGQTGSATTNGFGQASFTYTSNGATGTDTIQASGTVSGNAFSATAQKTWASLNNTCSTDVPKAIVDEDTVTSTLTVNNNVTIADLNVKLFITHAFDSDIVVTLTSPAGTSVDLFVGVGDDGQNFGSNCSPQPNCVIDDEAPTDIESGTAPFVGSFNPGGDELLSAFDGENAQGTWTLEITDVFAPDEGTLNCWCLEFLGTPTAVKLNSFAATGYDGGVFLEWQTGFEVDNLGFNIYREEGGNRALVNSQILAGSALLTGPGTSLTAGHSYAWWDEASKSRSAQYWLEDIDLKGRSTMHGPFTARFVGGAPPARSNAASLSQMGRTQNGITESLNRQARVARLSLAQTEQQNVLASKPAVKISVKREGWYRVTAAELTQAGLNPNANPGLLQLYVDGAQLPIGVITGGDGRLAAVEFYGLGLEAAHSDERTYWLTEGEQAGLRIEQVRMDGTASDAASFLYTVERKDRTIYFSSLRNGERENFFGAVVATQPVTESLALNHLAQSANGQATLSISLQGVTLVPHRVQVYLNESVVGEISFYAQEQKSAEFTVAQSLLKEGQNEVKLASQAGPSDISLIDHIRLSYRHSFTADGDQLRLTATGGQAVTIDGFGGEDIRVFDVTAPEQVREVIGKVGPRGNGFAVTATAPLGGERILLATRADKVAAVSKVAANTPSNLRSAAHAASLVIITDQSFVPALQVLRMRREGQGHKVEIVGIEDIFDEFSFGHKSPQAVKDFLSYAGSSWKTKPQNVLFAADASLDPKNYLGFGDWDIVPTKLVDTFFMETASDDWFADFDGDGLAEMAVGRLPVRTPEEAQAVVKKIIKYETTAPSESVMLVADINDGFDFEGASTQLRTLLPSGLRVSQINRGSMDAETAKRQLIEGINEGAKVVNYVGHGSVNLWRGDLLTSEDARELSNTEHLPVFVMMTCLNGYFHDAGIDSLAESLMKAERTGAVAVWASSGMCLPHGQAQMNQELYRLVFASGSGTTLGQATRGAKSAVTDIDIRRTWILIGDPTMKLR